MQLSEFGRDRQHVILSFQLEYKGNLAGGTTAVCYSCKKRQPGLTWSTPVNKIGPDIGHDMV